VLGLSSSPPGPDRTLPDHAAERDRELDPVLGSVRGSSTTPRTSSGEDVCRRALREKASGELSHQRRLGACRTALAGRGVTVRALRARTVNGRYRAVGSALKKVRPQDVLGWFEYWCLWPPGGRRGEHGRP